MHLATACVFATHCIRGTRTAWFPSRETTQASESGVASNRASTASAPILQPRILSKAEGLPPLCTCPRTVTLVSCFRLSTTTFLTSSAVMGCPALS
uniref:Putative secreted protein n=1 Tax=Ixodes ricinus TaxID=34613 RepID=A0A6B0U3T5_IXORI